MCRTFVLIVVGRFFGMSPQGLLGMVLGAQGPRGIRKPPHRGFGGAQQVIPEQICLTHLCGHQQSKTLNVLRCMHRRPMSFGLHEALLPG